VRGSSRLASIFNVRGKTISAITHNYDDFWLRNLSNDSYTLLIEKEGYLTENLGPIDATTKDQNLGDVVLWRTQAFRGGAQTCSTSPTKPSRKGLHHSLERLRDLHH
jgi:hypothetical protein